MRSIFGLLTLPESLESIGVGAFSGCSGFSGILTLPQNLTSLGINAFMGCSGFTDAPVLPEGIKNIPESLFENCTGFDGTLVLPESVESIDRNAFKRCPFQSVNSMNPVPPVITYGEFYFTFLFNTIDVFVPEESVEAYRQDPI